MLVHIPDVLTAEQVERCRSVLSRASWVDGRITAGHQSAQAKNNLQITEASGEARKLGRMITEALTTNALFVSAVLPRRIFPPLFNCYDEGMTFGTHVDNAIRRLPGSQEAIRTDVSATLFLSVPEDYDGGELTIEDAYGAHAVKLPAGDMVVYPSTSLHHVTPVTRGSRWAAFFWIESMVRDDGQRALLFDLDMAIVELGGQLKEHPALVRLTGCYHNLLRRWADA